MLTAAIFLGVTIPVTAIGLWLSWRDYRIHKRLTWLGLLGGAAVLFMPNLYLAWYKPWFTAPETPIETVGTVLWIAALVLLFASIAHFGKLGKVGGLDTSGLETRGIYRFSRNPQYVFWVLFILGYALTGPLGPGLLAVTVLCVDIPLIVLIEEKHLEDVYGEEYRRYREGTARYFSLRNAGGIPS